eukprot:4815043-Prymnesium_polylepis.1
MVNEVTNTVIFDASNATPYYDKTYLDNKLYDVATEDYVDTEIQYVSNIANSKIDSSQLLTPFDFFNGGYQVGTVSISDTTSTKLVTNGALLGYMGASTITTNGVNQYFAQGKLHARSTGETTDPNFHFIKSGVIDAVETVASYKASSQFTNNDNRLATVKAL